MKRDFLRSRAEQLADHLRACIARHELTEPLPGTRAWCEKLGVSRVTLRMALGKLQREGLLVTHPRKAIRLGKDFRLSNGRKDASPRMVRVVYYGRDYPGDYFSQWYSHLALRLNSEGIHLSLESCTHARLKTIARQRFTPREMLVLCSLPAAFHRYFAHRTRDVLVCGHPAPGSPLSYVTVDLESAVRQAAGDLLNRGFSRLSLWADRGTSPGVLQAVETFRRTCAAWPRQPVVADTIRTYLDPTSLFLSARRFAARVKERHGILVMDPVPESLLIIALLERGMAVSQNTEMVVVGASPSSLDICPMAAHYLDPVNSQITCLGRAVSRFFEDGALPRIRKTIPMGAPSPASL